MGHTIKIKVSIIFLDELIELIDSKVTIPRFQKNNLPESLNLASSVAIILGEIKRKEL